MTKPLHQQRRTQRHTERLAGVLTDGVCALLDRFTALEILQELERQCPQLEGIHKEEPPQS